jgi:alpha,alpha-trehalose phosphorylase
VGHLDLAYDYLAEAAFMDLQDREHNTKDGLHIASLAGAWTALVGGFGGMRAGDGGLAFWPKLPPGIVRLTFRMRYRGRVVRVSVHGQGATYSLLSGDPLDITHYGKSATVTEKELTLDIPPSVLLPRPAQPFGRAPQSHGGRTD